MARRSSPDRAVSVACDALPDTTADRPDAVRLPALVEADVELSGGRRIAVVGRVPSDAETLERPSDAAADASRDVMTVLDERSTAERVSRDGLAAVLARRDGDADSRAVADDRSEEGTVMMERDGVDAWGSRAAAARDADDADDLEGSDRVAFCDGEAD